MGPPLTLPADMYIHTATTGKEKKTQTVKPLLWKMWDENFAGETGALFPANCKQKTKRKKSEKCLCSSISEPQEEPQVLLRVGLKHLGR